MLRYAEVLSETDGPAAAQPYLNQARRRVNMPEYPTAAYPAGSREEVFRIIMHERMVELGGEQLRFQDLVRWDDNGKISMDDYIKNSPRESTRRPLFNKACHKIFPVPLTELSTNPNLGPQNPGY